MMFSLSFMAINVGMLVKVKKRLKYSHVFLFDIIIFERFKLRSGFLMIYFSITKYLRCFRRGLKKMFDMSRDVLVTMA